MAETYFWLEKDINSCSSKRIVGILLNLAELIHHLFNFHAVLGTTVFISLSENRNKRPIVGPAAKSHQIT